MHGRAQYPKRKQRITFRVQQDSRTGHVRFQLLAIARCDEGFDAFVPDGTDPKARLFKPLSQLHRSRLKHVKLCLANWRDNVAQGRSRLLDQLQEQQLAVRIPRDICVGDSVVLELHALGYQQS